MDFLLECIGFPPDVDLAELAREARDGGERVAWRGPRGEHLRMPLGAGLELRMDREDGQEHWTLLPYFEPSRRLRVAVGGLRALPDSPYDVLLHGRAHPAPRSDPGGPTPDAYDLAAILTDARKLPRDLPAGHVLGVALAGFALDVSHVGSRPSRSPSGGGEGVARIEPLGGAEDPGGCVEVALRVLSVETLENPLSGAAVSLLEVDAPGRSLPFFASPWQLRSDGLPAPEPGGWIEGVFLLTGRVAGGLGGPSAAAGRAFG